MKFKPAFNQNRDGDFYLPVHLQKTMSDYIIYGLNPGGFCTAMLANDLHRAVFSADVLNRKLIYEIARWIDIECPRDSFGSYERVENWICDIDGIRTSFVKNYEKIFMWNTLATG
jgi:hypothetical protein